MAEGTINTLDKKSLKKKKKKKIRDTEVGSGLS